MRTPPNPRQRADIFVSAKTVTEIPAAHELVRHALVQATLDPAVRAIDLLPAVTSFGRSVALNAVVLRRDNGSQMLDVVEARPLRCIGDEGLALLAVDGIGLPPLTLTAVDIRRQPKAANSSLVWSCRNLRIQATDRIRVLQALSEDGPMSLARLSAEVRWSMDPVAAVLGMACLDLVELDLTSIPLAPETVVQRRWQKEQ
jgi:hypothetical protein